MKRISKWAIAMLSLALPLAGYAHPGHGDFPAGDIRHYWGSPEHFVPIAILTLVLAAGLIQIVQMIIKLKAEKKVNNKR